MNQRIHKFQMTFKTVVQFRAFMVLNKLLVLVILMVSTVSFVQAQESEETPTPTPTPAVTPTPSEREKKLDEKIRIRTKEKTLADLEKDIREAQPSPTATPLTDSVNGADNLKMEAKIQTYKSVRQVTDRIACDIRTNVKDANVFVLYKAEDYVAWRNYKSLDSTLKQQLRDMRNEYDAWFNNQETALISERNVRLNSVTDATVSTTTTGSPGPLSGAFIGASTLLQGATSAARSLVDFLGMFRTNVDFTTVDVNVNENALKSMISDSLRRTSSGTNNECSKGIITTTTRFYDPSVFYPLKTPTDSILTYIEDLAKRRRAAEIEIANYEIVAADIEKFGNELESLETNLNTVEEKISEKQDAERSLNREIPTIETAAERRAAQENLEKIRRELSSLRAKKQGLEERISGLGARLVSLERNMTIYYRVKISRLKQLNKEFGDFFTALNTLDETTKISPLTQYVKVESLNEILTSNTEKAYWLEIRTVEAGGANRVQKNLIRYFYKPDISFSGGSILEFSVSDKEGSVVVSNADNAYEKYRKASRISDQ